MGSILRRLRFAFRTLRNAPAFSLLVIVILALGIGANTAVFSVIDAVLLRPLPYGDPGRLVVVWGKNPGLGKSIGERVPTSYANFAEWVRQARTLEAVAGFESVNLNRTGAGEPQRVDGARVSPNFFRTFSVDAAVGTTFNEDASDSTRAHVAVLSDQYWKAHFNSDASVIGKSITLNDAAYTIVGVLPERFYLPAVRQGSDQRKPDIWVPYDPSALGSVQEQNRRRMLVFARLGRGISLDQARAEMHEVAKRLQEQNPAMNAGFDINVFPISVEDVDPDLRRNLLVLLSAVGIVLLIACANISNLIVGRATQRQRELAIRKALGASRADLIAQMLAESAVLSCLGGALGVALAYAAIRLIASLKPAGLVRPEQIHLGLPVLIFTMLVSFAAAALFGILPAIRVSSVDVNSVLKRGGNASNDGARRMSATLVVTEVALATVLLIGAGFMIRSLQHALDVDPGFRPDHVLTMQLAMPPDHYSSRDAMAAFCRDTLGRISNLPGVKAASFADGLPMTRIRLMKFTVEGQPIPKRGSENFADMRGISSPEYFSTLGIPILAGRNFTTDEINQNLPVLVVNKALAKRLWPGQSAVGQHLLSVPPPGHPADAIRYTVIAVLGDAHQESLEDDPRPEITRPMPDYTYLTLAVRSAMNPALLTATIERQIWAVDKSLPIYNLRTMQDVVDESLSERRFSSGLLSLFSGLGIALACIGIYGILTFSVVQRTREIGIRMALGAGRADVQRMILREGLLLVVAGILIGVAAGAVLARLLTSLLFGLSPTNPATYALVFCGMLILSAAACYLPARGATSIEPTEALRYE